MAYKVKNWHRFQHFSNRRPLWIKLYREILDQRDINLISDRAFRVLVGCWLLASEDDAKQGTLPPIEDISFRLRIEKSKIISALQELTPWIYQDDINSISDGYQDDALEKEKRKRKRERDNADITTVSKIARAPNVTLTDEEYQTLISKHGKENTDWMIEKLDAYKESTGKRYRSDAGAIRSWVVKELENRGNGGNGSGKHEPKKPMRYFSTCGVCGEAGNWNQHGICDGCAEI